MDSNNKTPIQHVDYWSAEILLGLDRKGSPDIIEAVRSGLQIQSLETLSSITGLSMESLIRALGMRRQTLARRKIQGKLESDESDHLVSLAHTLACAINLFSGDKDAAAEWVVAPSPALGNIAPLHIARTHTGCRAVEALIGRLEHGAFS